MTGPIQALILAALFFALGYGTRAMGSRRRLLVTVAGLRNTAWTVNGVVFAAASCFEIWQNPNGTLDVVSQSESAPTPASAWFKDSDFPTASPERADP